MLKKTVKLATTGLLDFLKKIGIWEKQVAWRAEIEVKSTYLLKGYLLTDCERSENEQAGMPE